MNSTICSFLEQTDVAEWLDFLAVKIYESPLDMLRATIHQPLQPVDIVILIVDFDTELAMNGILGFLENSTGRYLEETIWASDHIGAAATSATLRSISDLLQHHNLKVADLREDFDNTAEYEITSFRQLHGVKWEIVTEAIMRLGNQLYSYQDNEDIRGLLNLYIQGHAKAIKDALCPS